MVHLFPKDEVKIPKLKKVHNQVLWYIDCNLRMSQKYFLGSVFATVQQCSSGKNENFGSIQVHLFVTGWRHLLRQRSEDREPGHPENRLQGHLGQEPRLQVQPSGARWLPLSTAVLKITQSAKIHNIVWPYRKRERVLMEDLLNQSSCTLLWSFVL